MRYLIYVPIIHMSADLGSLADQVNKRGVAGFGEEFWKKHKETISGFWDSIIKYFTALEVKDFKIYQDGLAADGEMGQKIVEEGVRAGSKNYEIIDGLLRRGAVLVQTEDFKLVKEERDRLLDITQTKSIAQKLTAFAKYKLVKNRLLNKRDNYIVKRIDETLNVGETGVLFVGAYHNIKDRLHEDIRIIEIKGVDQIREYQKLLPFYQKNKKRFEELGRYLVSEV